MRTSEVLVFATLLQLVNLYNHKVYHKCPEGIPGGCKCSGSAYIGHDISIACSRIEGSNGLDEVTTALAKPPRSAFLVDDLSYSSATTRLSYVNGDVIMVDGTTFAKMYRLRVLHLTANRITFLDEDAFAELKALEVLDLSHNKIALITPAHFRPLHQLLNLSLAHNNLQHLPDGVFKACHSLSYVNIAGEYIFYIIWDALQGADQSNQLI